MERDGNHLELESGDVLRDLDNDSACTARRRRRLRYFTGSKAGQENVNVDAEEVVEDLKSDNPSWILLTEVSERAQFNTKLMTRFGNAYNGHENPELNDTIRVDTFSEEDHKRLIAQQMCDDKGRLSSKGASFVSYYMNHKKDPVLGHPKETMFEIGPSGFIKRSTRYDNPTLFTRVLLYLDEMYDDYQMTAYRKNSAYVDFNGNQIDARKFLRRLRRNGIDARFKTDNRFDCGTNPYKVIINTSETV